MTAAGDSTQSSSEPAGRVRAGIPGARAEFRVFGRGIIDLVQSNMWNGKTVLSKSRKMPAETYFLSAHTNVANVKVRDGRFEIKIKMGETPEGYEIFQPRGQFQFPVSHADLATILYHLQVEMTPDAGEYDIDALVVMARKHPDLAPVTVEKVRNGFIIDDIVCEYAQVWFNGAQIETACVESENYAGMREVIEGLGLADMPNTSYLHAAKRVVGME